MHPYLNNYKPEDQLKETATVLTLAFLALNMISRSKLSSGNNVPNPSLGWTSTVYNKYGIRSDQNYTGFVQIFGSKVQDFSPTFFQNNNFFFQLQGYQI